MTDRVCIRGCTVPGVHYATCVDYGNPAGECRGCAPVEARDGVLLCSRCYGRLRRRLEVVPDLIAYLRSVADPLKAAVYDRQRVQGSGSDEAPAPVAADLLDAANDIMHVIGGGMLAPGASSDGAYRQALDAVRFILVGFDQLANDGAAILEWWRLLMSVELPELPEFWTVTRALSRWPLEDRKRWAKQPCPECGLRTVKVTPPRHRYSRTWFECASCSWRRTEKDDDGLWAAAFGQYAEAGHDEGSIIMGAKFEAQDIDLAEAIRAGIQYVLENAESVEKIGTFGVPTAAIVGAVPVLAERFAEVGDYIAAQARANYANGDLIAGGARLVATAIRDAVAGGDGSAVLASLAELAALTPESEGAAA